MDIHRCRFIPYPTSAINAVAFSHSSFPKKKTLSNHVQVRLAIGRANGDIEIWNPLHGLWHQETVIPGGKDRSIDSLVWVTDADEETSDGKTILGKSRLFSIGYTTAITEWDLEKSKPKKHASGQHGAIWSFGAQPPLLGKNDALLPGPRKLVAGTEDGNLLIYSTEDDDLRFVKSLTRTPSKNTKIVSIAFQTRNVVVVGCNNSTIGVYDIRNGTLLRKMNLGSGIPGGPKDIIVWSLKCLPRGDIVSGDSTGQVCIWDGKTYTQAQRIQGHKQDVLCLAVSADGSQIFSGGMDRRTALYEPKPGHGQAVRWSKVYHRRYHSHDVKTMAAFEGKGLSVVVSGGQDTCPVVIPLRSAGKEFHRTLSHLPQQTNIQSAPKARFVLSWWGNELRIWHLLHAARKLLDGDTVGEDIRKNRKLLARILVQGESSITDASISEDGRLLVASTATDIKVFQLERDAKSGSDQLHIAKVDVVTVNRGATAVGISPDRRWICWVEEGTKVMVAQVTALDSKAGTSCTISTPQKLRRLKRSVPKILLLGGLGSYDRKITQLAFSPDSKVLSTADLAGYIDTWLLRKADELAIGANGSAGDESPDASLADSSSDPSEDEDDDDASERWRPNRAGVHLPKLEAAPVVLTFCPGLPQENGDYTLLAITATKDVLLLNPLRGALSDWSRRNPPRKLPEQFRGTRDVVKGVVWQGPRAWVYGVSFLYMLDFSQDLPEPPATDSQKKGMKRKRNDFGSGAGGKMNKEHSLAPQVIRAATGPDGAEWEDMEMVDADDQKSLGASSGPEDDEYDTDGGELERLRQDQAPSSGDDDGKGPEKANCWHTYQYRPILGIVPLVSGKTKSKKKRATAAAGEIPPLEVALIERPGWELDMPPRLFGDGEWER